jgi:CHAD domain-containing protein
LATTAHLIAEVAREPLASTGRLALARTARRLFKLGNRTAARAARPTAEELHALRIRAKRLRYLLEFLRELTGRGGRRLVKRLVRLQDFLGAHQDAVVAAERLRIAAGFADAQAQPAVLLALGGFIEHERRGAARARADFHRTWRRFARKSTLKDVQALLLRLKEHAKLAEHPQPHHAVQEAATGEQPKPPEES